MTDHNNTEPLLSDEFTGEPPAKRLLAHLQLQREKGLNIVGTYCQYTPREILAALGLIHVSLCAFTNATIEAAETVLPANLCPLIKSSYGFIASDSCPFFAAADAVVAETTCDGKKKMFELISDLKPMFLMDLPQIPDEAEAIDQWAMQIRKLQRFLESLFGRTASDEKIEAAIAETNVKTRLMNRIFDFLEADPPILSWEELYGVICAAEGYHPEGPRRLLHHVLDRLDDRRRKRNGNRSGGGPRVMVTGCPVTGDAAKVLRLIEESGGAIVALEACSGMKPYMEIIEERTGDPVRALAARYLRVPCSCMTPNRRRLRDIDRLVERFRPHVVVDVILHACHAYNIESYKVGEHLRQKWGLPFLKIVTDFSQSDEGQIRTRLEALLETRAQ